MNIFDLHSHPGYKTIFRDYYSSWDNIPAKLNYLVGKIIKSQSSLTQIMGNNECNLLCISLYPPETEFVGNWLINFIGPNITDGLDKARLEEMINKTFSYPKEVKKEIQNLNLPYTPPPDPKPIRILKDFKKEYDPNDFKTLYIFFSIEGGHAFYGSKQNDHSDINQILADFSAFIISGPAFFYITPCHLTPNIFMTHAYGNKLLNKGEFIPVSQGITPSGYKFLDTITGHGLLIDVKHMSLVSRRQFYQYKKYENKPIICSHAGVTGISWHDKLNPKYTIISIKKAKKFVKVRYIKPKGILTNTFFNPCSINLYDEDIEKILKSGGMIGISMDLRIIGGERNIVDALKLNEKEFLSMEEFEIWEGEPLEDKRLKSEHFEKPYNPEFEEPNPEMWDEEDRRDEQEEKNTLTEEDVIELFSKSTFGQELKHFLFAKRNDEHLRFFVNQIFHILQVAHHINLRNNAWKHICIGSDFDGFIRSIDCCTNAGELENFANLLIEKLPGLAKEKGYILPEPADRLVKDLFFNNCYELMKKHF
ncbi:MAG: membrane dipeptidase [Ignavibacteriaceae bacterium]